MDAAAEHRHADVTATPSPALRARVLERPGAILPADALLHEVEDTRPFECDGLSAFRQLPMAVALPGDEAQVCEVLRICQELDDPVVARGGHQPFGLLKPGKAIPTLARCAEHGKMHAHKGELKFPVLPRF